MAKSSSKTGHFEDSWKTGDFEEIPTKVKESEKSEILQKRVPVKVDKETLDVFYQEALPKDAEAKKPPILFLHGMAFKSQTWVELGTMTLVGALGHRAVAVDLPGFGETLSLKSGRGSQEERVEFLTNFTKAVELEKPVIVSPSMSGSFAIAYLLKNPSGCGDLCSGYIPVAPVDTGSFAADVYKKCNIPVAIVYGSNDKMLGQQSLQNLKNFPKKEILCFEGAGHACYMNKPEEWHKTLYNFMTMAFE